MYLELCAYSLADCRTADEAGADRIELCAGRAEGGITPGLGLLTLARKQTERPLYAMIRPRGGDFLYNVDERAIMQADIQIAKKAGADGLVLGMLRTDGTVDQAFMRVLIDLAHPLPVTFHRAFDLSRDPFESLDALIDLGIQTVLTSGQQPAAEAGLPLLRELVRHANGRIDIMAGSGITSRNAGLFRDVGLAGLHLTAKRTDPSPMQFRRPDLSMASAVLDEYTRTEADPTELRRVRAQLRPISD